MNELRDWYSEYLEDPSLGFRSDRRPYEYKPQLGLKAKGSRHLQDHGTQLVVNLHSCAVVP